MSDVTRTERYVRGRSLPARLLAAADWFDTALAARMEAAGWPFLSRSQSLVFVNIDDDGTRPAELARRLGITRQSMQDVVKRLRDHDLVTVDVDPGDGRAMIVRLSARAHLLGRDAAIISAELERELAERIGAAALASLCGALAQDWGEPPTTPTSTDIGSMGPKSQSRSGTLDRPGAFM